MRSILIFTLLVLWGASSGQGSGFTFNYTGPTQVLVGPDCEAPLQWGHPNTPTATSNLPGGMIVSFTIFSISGGYSIGDIIPGGTTVTVFYQAIDNFGNMALFGFNIAFVDVLPPVFDPATLPQNITISCITQLPPPAQVEATDNCDNENTNLFISYSQNNNAQLCTGGIVTRTWVADDGLGNMATFNQTITVAADITPPVIANTLQHGMAPCSTAMAQYSAWLNAQRAAFTATDNGCGIMTLTDNAPSPSIITSFCGAIDVTFSATDVCNNTSTVVRTFTVTNQVAPVITTPASDASGNCSQPNIAAIFNTWINTHGGAQAMDDCSSIFWSTFPPNPSIHDTCDAAIIVMFIAGDGCNNFDTTTASFVLTDDTGPNFTTDPGTMVLSCTVQNPDSILLDWLVTGGHSAASDLCTRVQDLRLGYRISNNTLTLEEVLQAWQDSLASGCHDNVMIGGLGINNVIAYLPVEFTWSDKCDNLTGKIGYFGLTDNGRPLFTTPPVDTSFACSQSDNWQDVFLGWYHSAGASIYTDLCSEVTVTQSITADSAIQYLAAALDTACVQGVAVSVTFSLTDACGNTSLNSPSATFSLQDTIAPVLTSPAQDLIVSCSDQAEAQLHAWIDTLGGAEASDGCGMLQWIFSWTDTAGMTQTGIPGEGPYPPLSGLDCAAGLEVIFTAFDICQNSVSDTALFSIIDTLPPTIVLSADTIHLMCGDTIPDTTPEVTDDCDPDPIVNFSDSISIDSCLGLPLFIIRTWTATDVCGNMASAVQTFLRLDTIPPTFDLPPDTLSFCSIDTLILENVFDQCDPSPVVTWEDMLSGPECAQTLTRLWIVTDACGNSATAIQTFDLSDTIPPVITLSPGNFTYTCDAASSGVQTTYEQWLSSVVLTDGCSATSYFIAQRGSYLAEDTTTWPGTPLPDSVMISCGEDLLVEGDLVAYDDCGNVVIEPVSFTVMDTTGPLFTDCPALIIVEADTTTCDGRVILSAPPFEEICYPDDVTISVSIDGGPAFLPDSTLSIDTVLSIGFHTVEWIATDCKMNTGSCVITLHVLDENALILTCPPDTTLYTDLQTCEVLWDVVPPDTESGKCALGVISWWGYIEGVADPDTFTFESMSDTVRVLLMAGIHRIHLVVRDSTGDIDTCFYTVHVLDTFPPDIICQSDTAWLHPSGLDTIALSTLGLISSLSDACGIDTLLFDPPTVDCTVSQQDIGVNITAVDDSGNQRSCVTTLSVQTLPLQPLWERQLCEDTLRLFANIPAGPATTYTFSWTGPNGFFSDEENPVIPDSDTSFSGVYILTIVSENGCTTSGSTDILILELNAPVITVSPDTLCTGLEVTLTAQSYSGMVTYDWYHITVGGDTLLGSTPVPILSYIPNTPGLYSVYAIVHEDTCFSDPGNVVDFVVVARPVSGVLLNTIFLCQDDSLFLAPIVVFDSLMYIWTGTGGYFADVPYPPAISAGDLEEESLFVLTVSNAWCQGQPDSMVVFVQPHPSTPVISGDTLVCEGGTLTLTTFVSQQNYVWLDPAGQIYTTDQDTLRIGSIGFDQAGEWRVIVFENGCASDTSAGFVVQVDSALQIEINTPLIFCQGDSVTLSISPAVAGQYQWSGPGGFISDEASPTTLASNGTYTVSVSTSTGCDAAADISLEVDELPSILSLMTDADTCVNGMGTVIIWAETVTGHDPSYTYMWTGLSSFTQQDSSILLENVTADASGIYTLVIINGACTTDVASIELSLTDSPAAPVINGDQVYCFGSTIILTIDNPIPGAQYIWTSQGTNVIIASPGTLIIPNATPAWTGIYTVMVEVGGCLSPSSSIGVQVRNALLAPSILSMPFVCEGDSLILMSNAPSGAVHHWISSNGFDSMEERPVIYPATPADAGTYQLVYFQNGCASPPSNPFDIDVLPAVTPPLVTADTTRLCIDQPIPVLLCIAAESVLPGAAYNWFLNGMEISGTSQGDSCIRIPGDWLTVGENMISATSSVQGCRSLQGPGLLLFGDQIPGGMADAGPDATYCPGDEILLDAFHSSPATGRWTSDDELVVFSDETDPMADIVGLPSGMYTLYWTLSYATCLDYSTDEVLINIAFTPVTTPDTVDVPFGQTQEFIVVLNDQISMGPYTLEIVMAPQRGNALHAGNGIFRYTPNVGFVGTDMLIYRICSAECPDECSEAVVLLKVGNEEDCFIPTLFTPNEDGINDILIIPCLETLRYPNNRLIVFNEWGDAVYTAAPYQNDWRGTFGGNPLPVGTYFYIMDFGDGQTPKRTFLVLER